MKKALILFVVLLTLAGCSSKHEDNNTLTITSLKGPTSMGLAKLVDEYKDNDVYNFNIVTSADEVTAAFANETTDIFMLPANAAANLYNKASGFKVIAINTLGVLYLLDNTNEVSSINDLNNKTIYLPGKGTTTQYALEYVLNGYNIENYTLEFVSEPTEITSMLSQGKKLTALLPQPFATVASMGNDINTTISLTDLWQQLSQKTLVTGVTLVSEKALNEKKDLVNKFIEEYKTSINWVNNNTDEASIIIEELGIVGKAAIAKKALPLCNLVFIDGTSCKTILEDYYNILLSFNGASIGNNLPESSFYYIYE